MVNNQTPIRHGMVYIMICEPLFGSKFIALDAGEGTLFAQKDEAISRK